MYDLIKNVESCHITLPPILFYSHIPVMAVSLFLGIFVYFKNKKLVSRLLLFISLTFSMWLALDLVAWISVNSVTLMFVWSFFGILYLLLFFSCFYFLYVFIKEKDASFIIKLILFAIALPLILFTSTSYNVNSFDSSSCVILPEDYYSNYYHFFGFVLFIWMVFLAFYTYKKAELELRKRVALVSAGLFLFLLSFFTAEYLTEKMMDWGWVSNFSSESYGLFGMVIFIGFLAYLIVKYKAFNIKLLGAQALIVTQAVLIGSEFLFVQNTTNTVLVAITFVLTSVAGYILIRSVKLEVERKEQLQLMSNELAKKNEQLKKLDNAKTEFISIASHQLRTPLTAIKGFIAMLLDGTYGALNSEHSEVLNKVYQSNERLINLVEDLLNISRIESGRMEYKFDQWDMAKMGQEIIDTFMLKAKGQGLYLEYKNPEGLPLVITDGAKLREVVSNLVDNAIKYTPKGGVTLRITQEGEGHIRFTVSDTGIGVPQEELPYLFSKFSRGKDIGRLNAGGTGLGLYVGRSMIEALGGKIWAESDGANKGSRFIVEIPLEQKEMVYGKGLGMGVVK